MLFRSAGESLGMEIEIAFHNPPDLDFLSLLILTISHSLTLLLHLRLLFFPL